MAKSILTTGAFLCGFSIYASGPDQVHLSVVPESSEECAGASVYYDYDSKCTWTTAITRSSPSVDFSIEQLFSDNLEGETTWGWGRYQIRTVDARRELGVSASQQSSPVTDSFALAVGKMYAQFPAFLRFIMLHDVLIRDDETGGYFPRYCNRAYRHTGCGGWWMAQHNIAMPHEYYVNVEEDTVSLAPEFEEMVLHELGHALDYGTPDWFQADLWQTAVDADNAFVTEYAMTNAGEDFAESFVAWVIYRAYRERVDPSVIKSIERISHRLQYFDDRLNDSLASCKSNKPYESLFQC